MSYVLFLGFKCTVYKKPPTVRVSLNDIFLDEFSIVPSHPCDVNNFSIFFSKYSYSNLSPRHTSEFLYKKEHLLKKNNDLINKDIIFKVIEFDEINLKQTNTLKIEICNSDNNYTNGFMTKSTMISLYLVQFFPKKVLHDPMEFWLKWWDDRIKFTKTHSDIHSVKKFYKRKIRMYDILDLNAKKNKLSQDIMNNWLIPYHNTYTDKIENLEMGQWIGSSGFFQFQILKHLIETDVPIEIAEVSDFHLYCLANKYNQYAN